MAGAAFPQSAYFLQCYPNQRLVFIWNALNLIFWILMQQKQNISLVMSWDVWEPCDPNYYPKYEIKSKEKVQVYDLFNPIWCANRKRKKLHKCLLLQWDWAQDLSEKDVAREVFEGRSLHLLSFSFFWSSVKNGCIWETSWGSGTAKSDLLLLFCFCCQIQRRFHIF